MSKISILPENLANKIAAGEVVQRPESVVKELMENAIDAGSTLIEVLIKKAGKVLIQVIDNGEGMLEEDVILSVQKHATSKISTLEDLDAIKTLGFRGEALSAIAAVSQLEIKTETHVDELGTLLRVEESQVNKEKGSFSKGTSIAVKNLFFNTPGRRNFLKTDTTELKHIINTFTKLALSNPQIAFKLFIDDDLTFDLTSGTLTKRIEEIFGEEMRDALIPVHEETDYISLTGFIGKPSLLKKNKGEQYLFLNNRFVQSKQINHAVFTGYENVLEKGDYPFFILFLSIDYKRVDVNVHPSKLEVRFDDEKDIYNFVLAVIRKSLASFDLVPSLTFQSQPFSSNDEKLRVNPSQRIERKDFSDRPISTQEPYKPKAYSDNEIDLLFGSLRKNIDTQSIPSDDKMPFDADATEVPKQQQTVIRRSDEDDANTTFIIQLHNKYILSQIKTGLMIIDQHVAHERILYEKALQLFEANFPFSQQLIFSKTLDVDPATYSLLKELYPHLSNLGFTLKFFSRNTIVIEGIPQEVKQGTEEKILFEILEEYHLNEREKKITDAKDNIAKSYSCRTAIKAGDKLSEKEMRLLIDQLFATSMPYVCPHGRPIVVKISLEEFDRRFGRT
ncbi:MAG: DNA mismatch repair endonuclease MutL [Ignavibacteriaceae bacterium]|jgi:DNA mismatch repair protein MutL|nr:DNA mismatch repair endonuclease MutL [Ignavibacteriaceae bacterium]